MHKMIIVAVDAENISHQVLGSLISWARQQGEVVRFKAYGDFSMPRMLPWKAVMQALGCEGIDTPHLRSKNVADMTLAMDVIEDTHSAFPTDVVIASGDGDFTPLVMKLRGKGVAVTGFATQGASKHFKQACTSFRCFDSLPTSPDAIAPFDPLPKHIHRIISRICLELMRNSRRNEWLATSLVGDAIANSIESLNLKKHGIPNLTEALRRHGKLELMKDGKNVYFRRIQRPKADVAVEYSFG